MKQQYNLIILGGGAAGFAAANTANRLKKKTLMINDSSILPLGGTCVNVGCVPSKIMLHQGEEYYYPLRSKFRAIQMRGKINFVEALKETREMVKGFQKKNYKNVIEKQKYVDFKEGSASFVDKHTVKVGNEKFNGENIIIATGASTFIPPIKGIKSIDYLTNVNFFNLKEAPKSVIIIGGGPLGLEFSQIFHHFGIKTTVVEAFDRILPNHDSLIAEELKKHLEEEGITIYAGTEAKKVRQTKEGVEIVIEIKGKEKVIVADKLMIAAGLNPHTNKINVDKAGVKLNKKGFVEVDNYLQTTQDHIYAVGDVNGIMPLETVAAKQGSFVASNIFENAEKKINYYEIPNAVFTSPEVAAVGMTEEEYMKKYNVCLCRTISFEHSEKAAAIKDTRGIIRMVVDPKTMVVLGVHIVGPMASDIITTATYAIKNKMTIYDIKGTVHVFPTVSEVIKKVAQSFDQNLDEMACCVE